MQLKKVKKEKREPFARSYLVAHSFAASVGEGGRGGARPRREGPAVRGRSKLRGAAEGGLASHLESSVSLLPDARGNLPGPEAHASDLRLQGKRDLAAPEVQPLPGPSWGSS